MPELPEVEAARHLLMRVAVGRRIIGVHGARDPIVLEGVTPERLRRALSGRRIEGAERHGKHLWLLLDRRPWPVFHFGMTGGFHALRPAPARSTSGRATPGAKRPARRGRTDPGTRRLAAEAARERQEMTAGAVEIEPGVHLVSYGDLHPAAVWPPRFTRLRLVLEGGLQVAFSDARRLGRIRLRHDPRAEPPVSLLGFDAFHEIPSPAAFRALLRARGGALKAVLLDQSFAAGVGNWIADEALYQARLDPRRRPASLSDAEIGRLRSALRLVVDTSVRVLNDSARYPRSWLFHVRWGRDPDARTIRGHALRHETIGGRTTAWVPALQR